MYKIIPISLLWYDWNNIYTIWSLQCSLKTPSSCSSHLADQGWVGKVANFSGFILEQMVITWCYTFHRGPGTLREAIRPPVVFHFWDIWQFHICGWIFDTWEQTLLIHFIRMHLLFVVTIIYLATAWHIRLPHLQMYSESLMRLLWQWGWNNERLMRIIQMIIACMLIYCGSGQHFAVKALLDWTNFSLGPTLVTPGPPSWERECPTLQTSCHHHVQQEMYAPHIQGRSKLNIFLPKSRQPHPFNTKKSPDTPWEKQALWWWPSC